MSIKPKKTGHKLLVVVSDLHCGSTYGLMPPEAATGSGNTIGFGKNYHQKWLWEKWQEGIQRVNKIAGNDSFALLVNGDATEGVHHRTTEIVAAKIEDHTNMAVECLTHLSKKAALTMIVEGTECHTHDMESLIALKLGAVHGKALSKWLFEMNGVICDATHHIGTTSRTYLEASLMSAVLQNSRLNALRSGHKVARVFFRAHRHCGGHYSDGDSLLCITGGWQFLTRHGRKVVPDAIPRPSIMVMDWRNKDHGELPEVHSLVFNPPQDSILKL